LAEPDRDLSLGRPLCDVGANCQLNNLIPIAPAQRQICRDFRRSGPGAERIIRVFCDSFSPWSPRSVVRNDFEEKMGMTNTAAKQAEAPEKHYRDGEGPSPESGSSAAVPAYAGRPTSLRTRHRGQTVLARTIPVPLWLPEDLPWHRVRRKLRSWPGDGAFHRGVINGSALGNGFPRCESTRRVPATGRKDPRP